jgi:hypothetical protein
VLKGALQRIKGSDLDEFLRLIARSPDAAGNGVKPAGQQGTQRGASIDLGHLSAQPAAYHKLPHLLLTGLVVAGELIATKADCLQRQLSFTT